MQETTTSSNDAEQLLQALENADIRSVKALVVKQGIDKSLRNAEELPLVYSVIKKIGKKPDNASYSKDQLAAYKAAKLLIKNGFDLNQGNHLGNTALHQAIKGKHVKLIKLLIDKDCDVNAKNKHGQTPLYFAIESNDVAIFEQIVNAEKIDPYIVLNNPIGKEKEKTIFDVLRERKTQSGKTGKLTRTIAKNMQDILKERVRLKNLKVQHIDSLPITTEKTKAFLLKMQQEQHRIFMSYSWSEETHSTVPMVLSCRDYLKQNQIAYYLDRDEERGVAAIGEGYLERFMRTAISESHVTVAFINEAYLTSRNCLFELSQFWDKSDKENPKFKDNLHIVIHPEFNLYGNATNATKYINYWKERKEGNNKDAKTIDDIEQQRQHINEAEFLKEVVDNIAGMVDYMATKRVYPTYEELRTSAYYAVLETAVGKNRQNTSLVQTSSSVGASQISIAHSLSNHGLFSGNCTLPQPPSSAPHCNTSSAPTNRGNEDEKIYQALQDVVKGCFVSLKNDCPKFKSNKELSNVKECDEVIKEKLKYLDKHIKELDPYDEFTEQYIALKESLEKFHQEKLPIFLKKEKDLLEKLSPEYKGILNSLTTGKQKFGGEVRNSRASTGISDAPASGQHAKTGDVETKGAVIYSNFNSSISYRKG